MKRALLALALGAGVAAAQPATVLYQGFLTDDTGTPVDGTVDLFFSLYEAETGGTPVWIEAKGATEVVLGAFSVELGLAASDLAQRDLWLGLAVDTAGNELSPRQRVSSAPWALRCADTDLLGGLDPGAFQARITGNCSGGDAIRQVNPDGSVVCEPDDTGTGALTGILPGPGLSVSGTSLVTVDVLGGAGLVVSPDVVALDFSGSSGFSALASRADHDHFSGYVPQGGFTSCGGTDKASFLDPLSGDLLCDLDQDRPYAACCSGSLQQVGNDFSLNGTLFLSTLYSQHFYYASPVVRYLMLAPAEFRTAGSADSSYVAFNGQGRADFSVCGPTCPPFDLMASIDVPRGVAITSFDIYYRLDDPTSDLACYLSTTEHDTGLNTLVTGSSVPYSGIGANEAIQVPVSPPLIVDNDARAYVAWCTLTENAGFVSVSLYGYRVRYEMTELTE